MNISQGSHSWEISESQIYIDKSINYLYNFEFDSSLIYLDIAEKIDIEHPVIPFLRTSALWLKVQTEVGFEESYEQIKKSIDIYIPFYKNNIELYPSNPEYYLYLGSLYGLLSRIELAYGHWFKVLFPTMKGYYYVSKAYEIDPFLYDVYTPMGMSSYYACMSEGFIKFCSKVIGVEMDCELSIEYLETASDKSYYSWIEANNILAYIYIYRERDFVKALDKINPLLEEFPNHPYFPFLKGAALVRMHNWEEYEELRPILEDLSLNHNSSIVKAECLIKLRFLDAYKAFYNNDYLSVVTLTTEIINNYNMEFDWMLGLAHYLRANAYIEIDEIDNAKSDLLITSNMKFKFPEVEEAKELYLFLDSKE